jgi:Uma2 family endonuclease
MQLLDPQPIATTAGILLHHVSWEKYESLLGIFGDDYPGLRLNYLEGQLEIMTTSDDHEQIKKMIARLLELYALEKGINLYSCGSATFRQEATQRGLEPDESYCINSRKPFPDLAIEVIITSGLVNRIDIYQGLGIPEIWIWKQGQLTIQQLNPEQTEYQPTDHSQLFPELDLALLSRFINPQEEPQMIRAFRDSIKQS